MEQTKSNELVCELERNFVYLLGTEEKLLSIGARMVTHLTLTDSYYDTCQNVVCLSNHWLRNRNQSWELKYCPLDQASSAWNQATGGDVTKYLEEVDPDKIKLVLSDLFLKQGDLATRGKFTEAAARMCSLDECIVNADLKCFASFTTFRKVYRYDDLTVNLDRTDSGICVGEIEMTVIPTQGLATSLEVKAKQKIEEFGKKLGIEWKKTPGKLEMYLIKNNPKLYDQLIAAKVLFKA